MDCHTKVENQGKVAADRRLAEALTGYQREKNILMDSNTRDINDLSNALLYTLSTAPYMENGG